MSTLTDELSLAVDFFKDEIVSEEEVDALYNKAVKAIEALELRNMLRQEEDPMDAVLKINSEQEARRAATGPRCSCVCTCAGARHRDIK